MEKIFTFALLFIIRIIIECPHFFKLLHQRMPYRDIGESLFRKEAFTIYIYHIRIVCRS
ncbi:hypothetical protein HMPREF1867_01788 [Veillonella dispar]|nr:hypothetical protein HMPREF1867_01788 [Veillonella dispar]